MAEHLASIYGTEKDKVNCSFYFKIGACRHGDKCSRKHVKPTFSQTLLLPNMYHNPSHDPTCTFNPAQLQQHFDLFYEDVFVELAKYGEIEEMNVCDNVGDHLVGNVYVRFSMEEEAGVAADELNKRFYAGRPLYAELSPVTDFKESCCRQHDHGECNRGGFCNFMHLRHPTKELLSELFASQEAFLREKRRERGPQKASSPHHRPRRSDYREERRPYPSDHRDRKPDDDHGGDRDRKRRERDHGGRDERVDDGLQRYGGYEREKRRREAGPEQDEGMLPLPQPQQWK